jgi:hypothetical protein
LRLCVRNFEQIKNFHYEFAIELVQIPDNFEI